MNLDEEERKLLNEEREKERDLLEGDLDRESRRMLRKADK
jgi:hypothetical protein